MRFNDRELIKLGSSSPVIEGILQHMKPQGNDWSDWYQQPAYKDRIFKLVNNILFYYRIHELEEPLGILVLENVQVAYENKGLPFAFSLTFSDGKHVFGCRCEADVNKWVSALKVASYQHWRSLYTILQTKISMRTGKDPVLDYVRSKQNIRNKQINSETVVIKTYVKSSFYSHTQTTNVSKTKTTTIVPVDNLIDL